MGPLSGIRVVGIDHAARPRDPPQPGRLQMTRQVACRQLDVGVGADDDFFAIGHVARQQHGQGLTERRRRVTHWF